MSKNPEKTYAINLTVGHVEKLHQMFDEVLHAGGMRAYAKIAPVIEQIEKDLASTDYVEERARILAEAKAEAERNREGDKPKPKRPARRKGNAAQKR